MKYSLATILMLNLMSCTEGRHHSNVSMVSPLNKTACIDPSGVGTRNFMRRLRPIMAASSALPTTRVSRLSAIMRALPSSPNESCVPYSTIRAVAGPDLIAVEKVIKDNQCMNSFALDGSLVPESEVILGRQTGGQGGMNAGGFFTGADGVSRYVKFYTEETQVFSEHLANAIYRDIGLSTPNTMVFWHNKAQKYAYASETLQSVKSLNFPTGNKEVAREFLKGFVADVLLANREIIGGSGNTLFFQGNHLSGSKVIRLDSGSALLMRSTYGRKLEKDLPVIREWEGFQKMAINPPYARSFLEANLSESERCTMFAEQWRVLDNLVKDRSGWANYISETVPQFNKRQPEDFDKTVKMLSIRLIEIKKKLVNMNCMK